MSNTLNVQDSQSIVEETIRELRFFDTDLSILREIVGHFYYDNKDNPDFDDEGQIYNSIHESRKSFDYIVSNLEKLFSVDIKKELSGDNFYE